MSLIEKWGKIWASQLMGEKSIFQNLAPNHDKDSQHTRNGRLPQIDKRDLQKQSKIKPHVTIILNGERLNIFFPQMGNKASLCFHYLYSMLNWKL